MSTLIEKINAAVLNGDFGAHWLLSSSNPLTTNYLIHDEKIVGKMITLSANGSFGIPLEITVKPGDDATREFFKDDYTIPRDSTKWIG